MLHFVSFTIEIGLAVSFAMETLVVGVFVLGRALVKVPRLRVHTAAFGLFLIHKLVVHSLLGPADSAVCFRRFLGEPQAQRVG